MKLSIVTTLYQSASTIEEFHRRASAAARELVGDDYEIVLVNDGSPDDSLDIAVKLVEKDPHTLVVDLSRNFGHHKAMMTGLAHSIGGQVFLIDSDLEEDPEWVLTFAEKLEKSDGDVVYGIQRQRKGSLFEQWSGYCFYSIFDLLTGLALPISTVTARLMTRQYVDSLLLHQEREVFMAGLWHITGFAQYAQPVQKKSSSKTTYTVSKKITLLINAITSFSNKPLIIIFYIGALIFLFASGYSFYLIINKVFFSHPLSGWTSIIASIWLLGGMMISFLGIIGIYLSKVFSEIKQRPYTIVRRIYGGQ